MNIMFLYILEKGNVIKISDKLNIFLQNILYNYDDFDKNYSNNYDELNLVLKNKDALINKTMTPTQMQIIEYILEHDGSCVYQKDLENVLKLRRATVSGVLQTMEKNGFIERVIDKNDTRVKKIILNKKTSKIFYERLEKIKTMENNIKKGISQEELETFFRVILKMQHNIQEEEENEKTN